MINNQLSKQSFDKHSVWKWNDSSDGYEPVLNYSEARNSEPTLFIKADFLSADGSTLNGYLVGRDSFYAFGLFVNETEYLFNFNLDDMFEATLEELKKKLKSQDFKLFPLKYKTEISLDSISEISGELNT